MNINIGDTVRFLREVGGGKVTGFRKGGLVLVEDEDGFEIPMLESDLVVIPDNSLQGNAPSPSKGGNSTPTPERKADRPATNQQTPARTTPLFDQDYNYTAPETLEERVAKLESMVFKLTRRLDEMEAANALRMHAKAPSTAATTPAKKPGKDEIIEVDLHAHALLDSTDGLSPTEIKDYQMKVFREKMELFRRDKGRRLVFIHGNGDGVLRKAILTELKYTYKTCRHQDASFQQYGFGATMVTIG